ncbi:MAG TPA: pitrilysin family protein [Syntrophorhabdaceae bacterium]|nr:pitrilysin family protein [Syntrophorhabdaceae bacterium]
MKYPCLKRIACIFLLLLLALTQALEVSSAQHSPQDPVVRTTLDNGLKVVVVPNRLAPVATIMVNYLVGSNEAPEGFPGTAHALEHMMFRGSPGLTAGQLSNIIAALGGMFNANTQQTVTQYFLTLPAEDLEIGLRIESIRMNGVLDTEDLWLQERGAIEQEVAQDLSNPDYIFYTKLLASMFKGTPYSYTPLGTVASFQQTTGAMLKQFHDTWYAPNNAILVIVGDVDPSKVISKVKQLFSAIPSRQIPARPKIELQPINPETFNLKTDDSYGMVALSFRMPGYSSPDYPAAEVLSEALSNQRSDLYNLVPEGKALFAGFNLSTLPETGIGYAMAAFPKGADSTALLNRVREILRQYIITGFSSDLVEAAKRAKLTKTEINKTSIPGLAMEWSDALTVRGRSSPEDDTTAIQLVTVSDVHRVAKEYLQLDKAIIAVLTPEASGKPSPSKSRGTVESFTPRQAKKTKLPDWTVKALRKLSVPAMKVKPSTIRLPNGIRLIIQPESSSEVISLYGKIKNRPELQTPKDKEGVDEVLDQLLQYGTTNLDRIAFQKALDEIGASESAGTEFSLQVLAKYFDRAVELLAGNMLRPALPEDAFTVIRKQTVAAVAGRLQSPDYLADHVLKTVLFPKNDPALRQATPDSVSSLTLRDVKDYYRSVFRPDLTTIVVIGNIDPKSARSVIRKYFSSWKAEGPRPRVVLPSVPLNKPTDVAVPNTSRIQEKVVLAQTLGLNRTHPEYYALEMGNHVLGGAFYATRLYQDLREQTGLVYYVSSTLQMGEKRSVYTVEYGCDPQNLGRARSIVERNLKDMQTSLVPPDQLRQTKALLLRGIILSESSFQSIAMGLIYRSLIGLPLNEPAIAARKYIRITASQVRKAFVRWISPDNLVQVTEGPPGG